MFANLCDTAATGDAGQTIAKVRQSDMAKEMEPVVRVLYNTLSAVPHHPSGFAGHLRIVVAVAI